MWHFFKSKPLLSEEDAYFQIECYKWLLRHFGGDAFYQDTLLVRPTTDFFPTKVDSEQAAAEATFESVKKYAGLTTWPCRLLAQETDPNLLVAPTIQIQQVAQSPLGTFSADEHNEVIITYNPKIVSNPTQMVATFAHELAHYLTATAPEPPPGGWENWEFATDIATVFLGFGIFVANAAFHFQQYTTVDSQGWQVSGGGYLSATEYSYALAIFLSLQQIPYEQAYVHCSPNIKHYLKQAKRELQEHTIIDTLKEVEFIENAMNV